MNLADAKLQQATGFAIIPGRLAISRDDTAEDFNLASHDWLLLGFPPALEKSAYSTFWPVTDFKRDDHGFYTATLCEFGLHISKLSPSDLGDLSFPEPSGQPITRNGPDIGYLTKRKSLSHGLPPITITVPHTSIRTYELVAQHGPEGLKIAISGKFGAAEAQFADGLDLSGRVFSVEAAVSWETLSLKGFRLAMQYWKFGHRGALPSKIDTAGRLRDPRKLQDMLVSQEGYWPYFAGRISFTPETAWPPKRFRSADSFVCMLFSDFGPDAIHFNDAPRVGVLDNGFAWSDGANRFLTIAILGRTMLEARFARKDSLSMQLTGDALGSVRYQTGYGHEPSDPLSWIGQQIRTMSLRMTLGSRGLEMSVDGELDDFEPAEIARHRQERNSKLEPVRTYELAATIPWAFLAARGFGFAARARNF